MSFPKVTRVVNKNKETVKVQFLIEKLDLTIDKDKCVGCGVCARVCPKEAVQKKTLDEPVRLIKKQIIKKIKHYLIPYVRDPNKCSYCGICVYCCPFDALQLRINDREIPPNELPVVLKKAVPKLEYKEVTLDSGRKAKVYVDGSITIDTTKCAGGCTNCALTCENISQAIKASIIGDPKDYNAEIKLEIFDDKCIHCGACRSACPTEALTLKIDKVKYSGDFNEPFWPNIVEKLKLKKITP